MPPASLAIVITNLEKIALLSVDVINGFCYEGPLASQRVAGIFEPIVDLFKSAWMLMPAS